MTEVTTNISPTLATEATQVQEKFEKLFTLFTECHLKINSSKAMDDEALDKLGTFQDLHSLIIKSIHTQHVNIMN